MNNIENKQSRFNWEGLSYKKICQTASRLMEDHLPFSEVQYYTLNDTNKTLTSDW